MTQNKPKINGVVVVEGKTDTVKLKALFDVQTIETNGSEISKKTINLILRTEQKNKIILFLDPDGPGEMIRKKIVNHLTKPFFQCFIKKTDINKCSKKIGVAEAKNEAIFNAFQNFYIFEKSKQTLSQIEYDELLLNTKQKRQWLCDYLKISYANNKQLLKILNMLGYTKLQMTEILKKWKQN